MDGLSPIVNCTTLAVLLVLCCTMARAQTYPTKPVRMLVASAPGGGPDIMARIVGQKLSEYLGQSVVIENRTGANGIIGSEAVARAAPDGYTLLMANAGSHAVNVSLYHKLPYDPLRDFAAVSLVSLAPNILVVHPSLPARSVKELIALARARPGKLDFGSGGTGSTAHLSGEMFKMMAAIDIVHVPFKGAAAAAIAIISGEVTLGLPNIPPALPHVKSGRLRALAVTTVRRSSSVPDLPTVAEAGLPGYEATAWYGVLAPAGTPRDILTRLNSEVVKAVRTQEVRDKINAEGGEAAGTTPEEFTALMKDHIAKWAKVVRASGARAD